MKVWVAIWERKGRDEVRVYSSFEGAERWRREIAEKGCVELLGYEDSLILTPFMKAEKYFEHARRKGKDSEYFRTKVRVVIN